MNTQKTPVYFSKSKQKKILVFFIQGKKNGKWVTEMPPKLFR
jgi:hypothetical protein